ncbi:uncharacterized protein K460DRAFT_380142 [Cucurbitaria berberidis CBS 394.84]|uniref:Uncharacterized protein n=1 Tax=Cucurbitaria berberidis CBS 394.84 TaxID=1168544 RepID=A0A9P4L548_9PLEO|nr:uncharacterized protein K460DRAFT_380142 [Cucurbitaria berberidis CBS 394.84]KAF1842240.1 hypothetical protein K460DRAFT_380142 [Cucurbitaria berberidis CBS 394.84]
MSHTLFTKAPALRTAARRSIPRVAPSSAYHSSSGRKMPSGTAPIRNLLRQTTLRASAIAAQRTSYPASQQFSQQTYIQQQQRPRSPSPPPPYQARNISVLAPQNQWTRFTTPYNTLSSVRTFVSSPKIQFASHSSSTTALSPEAQQSVDEAIEEIHDLYGTAKDEFEIASEETEKNTTYAEDDRAAAREELDRLLAYYAEVTSSSAAGVERVVADEVKRRVGHRVRELEHAVLAMEEAALHHD